MFDPVYVRQAELLARCLPEIGKQPVFAIYLASHDRPMHELLNPQFKNIAAVYAAQFAGMARNEVPVEALCQTRERLVALIRGSLDDNEKRFLLSIVVLQIV